MYDIPKDCVLTYNPSFMDFHSDSTDFEGSQIQRMTSKDGTHSLVSKKNKKPKHFISVNPITYKANTSNIKISKNSSIEMWAAETIDNENGKAYGDRQSYVSKEYRAELDSGDQIETVKSKRSLIRHKVIPCIYHMSKRSYNHGKRMSIIKERNTYKDTGCQTFRASYEPKMKQLDRRQQSYPQSKNSHKSILTRKIQRCAQYSLTSLSEADRIEVLKKKDKSWKWKKPTINVMKSYVNEPEEQNFMLDKELRNNYSKRRRKFPFQVYASRCQYSKKNTANSTKVSTDIGNTTSAVPSTCSRVWDCFLNKTNNKYQTPEPHFYKPCYCHHSNISSPKTFMSGRTSDQSTATTKPRSKSTKGTNPKDKENCKCPSESSSKDLVKPCQVPHTCLTKNVRRKYNGEILCIHNPPCVLINGCLNLPYPKSKLVPTTMWPIIECHRAGFQHFFRKKRPKNYVKQASQAVEQACQYQPMAQSQNRVLEQSCQYQVIEQSCQYQMPSTKQYDITDRSCQYYPEIVNTCQVTDHKKEKLIQSSCDHKPPCEVKRTCYRPKYDPQLQSSCIHVPICGNLPMCILDSSYTDNGKPNKTCRHKPKCAEVPICRRHNYLDLTRLAREAIGTQVQPKSKMICRHEPPCLMVPRCLDRLSAESCQNGAVPSCMHQPMCAMIPECCRKTAKEMVSVCSQHPNLCRIV